MFCIPGSWHGADLPGTARPNSGDPDDADPAHRHAVRLTRVEFTTDPLYTEGEPPEAVRVVDIEWAAEDALPFPLCVHRVQDPQEPGTWRPVSVASGNVVLADHGRTIPEPDFGQPDVLREDLGAVPEPRVRLPSLPQGQCEDQLSRSIPPRYRPSLKERPVTQAVPYNDILFRLKATSLLEAALDSGHLPAALGALSKGRGCAQQHERQRDRPRVVWAATRRRMVPPGERRRGSTP
jgi:hypothetical protein